MHREAHAEFGATCKATAGLNRTIAMASVEAADLEDLLVWMAEKALGDRNTILRALHQNSSRNLVDEGMSRATSWGR